MLSVKPRVKPRDLTDRHKLDHCKLFNVNKGICLFVTCYFNLTFLKPGHEGNRL